MLPTIFIILWTSVYALASYLPKVDTGTGFRRTGQDMCNVCFGGKEEDCFVFESILCEFYTETVKLIGGNRVMPPLLKEAENPRLRAEVNALLFSVTETGLNEQKKHIIYNECIPYVSTYTNCDKENICTGCQSCDCDAFGRWNCTIANKCRPDTANFVANHETLINVIDNLKGDDSKTRKKRSLVRLDHNDSLFAIFNIDRDNNPEQDKSVNQESATVDSTDNDYQPIHVESTQPVKHKTDIESIEVILKALINDLPEILVPDSKEFENNRVKRWIPNSDHIFKAHKEKKYENALDSNVKLHNISFKELSEWLYDVHPLLHYVKSHIDGDSGDESIEITTVNTDPPELVTVNPDNLVFDEVYSGLATDSKNHTLRKPLINKYSDYNLFDEVYSETHTDTTAEKNEGIKEDVFGETQSLINYLAKLDNYQSTTEIIVDLLKSSNKHKKETDSSRDLANAVADLDKTINENVLTAVNIMKRDLTSKIVNKTSSEETIPKNITTMNSTSIQNLKIDVLDPIDNILKDKQREIQELLKIRESLINFINTHKDDFDKNNKSTILSIFKVEVLPQHQEPNDLRKSNNGTLVNKYLVKLKKDMFEVIRDIISIRKLYSDKKQMPQEFKYLIKAMNHYIHKTGFHSKRRRLYDVLKSTRRTIQSRYSSPSMVKSEVVKVLEVLDKDKPEYCALMPVSPYAQRLLKRIIQKHYVDVFAAMGLRVHEPNYNMTDDLKNVGSRWSLMSSQIEKAPMYDKLHHMKMLQLVLSLDMAKVMDALKLIRFAKGRRSALAGESQGEKVVDDINKNLLELSKWLVHTTKEKPPTEKSHEPPKETKKKNSFLNQIKKMLLNSKKDIMKLFRRKVPNTEIVKLVAKKEIEEAKKKKLADTMSKWQSNLNIISNVREKRSVKTTFEGLFNRMKSIIPKYLRGKVPSRSGKKSKGKKKLKSDHKTAAANSKTTSTFSVVSTTKSNIQPTLRPTTLESSPAAVSSVASLI